MDSINIKSNSNNDNENNSMAKWNIIKNPFMLNTVITNNVKPSAFVDDRRLTWETILLYITIMLIL